MKVQVQLNDELVEKIDILAKSIGISRSSLCAVWIGQTVYGYDKLYEQTKEALNNMVISDNQ